jgi:hypothetical protein
MTKLQALIELRDAVKAGDGAGFRRANRAVFSTPCQDMELQLREERCRHAYKGSLDAAKALHEAVLPDFRLSGMHQKYKTMRWYVCIDRFDNPDVKFGEISDAPARAWLLAILEALIAQEQGKRPPGATLAKIGENT